MTGTLAVERPELLWLLLLWLPLLGLVLYTRRRLSPRRRLLALALRTLLLLAVVFALAEATWRRPTDELAVVFVMDRSASVGPEGERRALTFVQEALQQQGPRDLAGVVVFGADALVEAEPRAALALHGLESTPSPHHSDLSAGLRLGTALLPADRTRRLVLLTDGEQNRGDAAGQALLTATGDLSIAVVGLGDARGTDVLLEDLAVPARVDRGAPFDVRVVARADVPTTATLRLYRNDRYLGELPVDLDGQRARVLSFRQQADEPGLYRYRAELQADPGVDTVPRNNRVVGTVQVAGQPRVLYAEGDADQARHLLRVLEEAGLQVDVVPPDSLPPGLPELRPYAAVFLSDVPAWALSRRQQEALRSYVRDLGRGLVMIGGDRSFGVGGWHRSPVEDALPVQVDLQDRTRFPKLAMVLAIDKSCSMGGGAGSKIALAREAAIQTADLLSDHDMLGVIGFDGAASWISPLQRLDQRDAVIRDIASLRAGGGTDIYPALEAAITALDASDAALKHIILLSDGMTTPGDYQTLLTDAHARKITVTAVGVGSDTDQKAMTDFARWGGGNVYLVVDPDGVPAVFTREALLASRSFLIEEPFRPLGGAPSELVRGLDVAGLPPLQGYVATEPRDRATVALMAPGEEHDAPLLAHWRYGLGRSVAFTSDAKARWARDWLGTPAYARLWTQIARWAIGDGEDGGISVHTEVRDGTLTVAVDGLDGAGGFRNFLKGEARIVAPDLTVHTLDLRQVGPGRYEARHPAGEDGSWLVGVAMYDGGTLVGQAVSEAVQPYSPEYRYRGGGDALLAEIGRVGGGGDLTDPREVFRRPEVARVVPRPLWPGLIALAAALLLLDVAARRLDLRPSTGPLHPVRAGDPRRTLPLRGPRAPPSGAPGAPAEPVEPDGPAPVEVAPDSYAGRLLAARRTARRKLDE